jgi:hypothetical protein
MDRRVRAAWTPEDAHLFAVLLVVHPLHQVTLLNPLAKKL